MSELMRRMREKAAAAGQDDCSDLDSIDIVVFRPNIVIKTVDGKPFQVRRVKKARFFACWVLDKTTFFANLAFLSTLDLEDSRKGRAQNHTETLVKQVPTALEIIKHRR
jgi:hypothetical protein